MKKAVMYDHVGARWLVEFLEDEKLVLITQGQGKFGSKTESTLAEYADITYCGYRMESRLLLGDKKGIIAGYAGKYACEMELNYDIADVKLVAGYTISDIRVCNHNIRFEDGCGYCLTDDDWHLAKLATPYVRNPSLPTGQDVCRHQAKRLSELSRAGIGYPEEGENLTPECYVNNVVCHIDHDYITFNLIEVRDIVDDITWSSFLAVRSGGGGPEKWEWYPSRVNFFALDSPSESKFLHWFIDWTERHIGLEGGK